MEYGKPIDEQRLECIEEQIKDFQAGHIRKIGCPYCGAANGKNQMCCDLFAKGVAAVLDRMEYKGRQAIIDKVLEKISRN